MAAFEQSLTRGRTATVKKGKSWWEWERYFCLRSLGFQLPDALANLLWPNAVGLSWIEPISIFLLCHSQRSHGGPYLSFQQALSLPTHHVLRQGVQSQTLTLTRMHISMWSNPIVSLENKALAFGLGNLLLTFGSTGTSLCPSWGNPEPLRGGIGGGSGSWLSADVRVGPGSGGPREEFQFWKLHVPWIYEFLNLWISEPLNHLELIQFRMVPRLVILFLFVLHLSSLPLSTWHFNVFFLHCVFLLEGTCASNTSAASRKAAGGRGRRVYVLTNGFVCAFCF